MCSQCTVKGNDPVLKARETVVQFVTGTLRRSTRLWRHLPTFWKRIPYPQDLRVGTVVGALSWKYEKSVDCSDDWILVHSFGMSSKVSPAFCNISQSKLVIGVSPESFSEAARYSPRCFIVVSSIRVCWWPLLTCGDFCERIATTAWNSSNLAVDQSPRPYANCWHLIFLLVQQNLLIYLPPHPPVFVHI